MRWQRLYGKESPWYRNWIHSTARSDRYWNSGCWGRYATIAQKVNVPILLQTGWYDIFLDPTLSAYRHLSDSTRSRSRLIVDPWHHGNTVGGDLPCPDENRFGTFQVRLALEWFDATVKGIGAAEDVGAITAYDVGAGAWRRFSDGLQSNSTLTLYASAEAGDVAGARKLTAAAPQEDRIRYVYDPTDPVPSRGGKLLTNYNELGAPSECSVKQDAPGARADVISFVSDAFAEPTTLLGEAVAVLRVCSDADDTAFTAKIMEVRPDGAAYNVRDGICTLAHRNGDAQRLPYEPNTEVDVTLHLGDLFWTVGRGSRIRADISSSNFPAFHVHPNYAGCWADVSKTRTANQTVKTGANGTRVILSVEEPDHVRCAKDRGAAAQHDVRGEGRAMLPVPAAGR